MRIGDKVQVVAGELQGMAGQIVNMQDLVVSLQSEGLQNLIQVRAEEVRKRFELGDFVKVVYGQGGGFEGWIVDLVGESAMVY